MARGLCWDSRTPWRHAHVMPGRRVARWAQVGWWGLVVLLMGLVVLLTVRDGYSEEPASTGELVVTFNDGVIRYPEGAASVLSQRVEFRSASLQRLNAHFGLVAVARVVSPARPTASTFRLRFASSTGLRRALAAYQRDPHVRSATLGLGPPSSSPRPGGVAAVCTLDA
ncbi:MAG: hypothetical protein HY600_00285 [Candidatus Omnitrophica bacterium]|nr:hypothetical protein [Candidatus Omnitrophota bacterium]